MVEYTGFRFLFFFMVEPIADRIRIQARTMSFDRLTHRGGMGCKEERSQVDKLWREGKLCPYVLPVLKLALW
jgi:hypothetical protein